MPSSMRSIMLLLLRDNARTNSFGRTRRKSTRRGTLTPCRAPMLLIQLHRLLWMWAAIIPTVSREMPGTCLDQTAEGSCSTRYVVARLFVRQAAMIGAAAVRRICGLSMDYPSNGPVFTRAARRHDI